MKLLDYVDEYYGGNKAAFARAYNRSPQGVSKMFRNSDDWIVWVEDDQHTIAQVRARLIPETLYVPD